MSISISDCLQQQADNAPDKEALVYKDRHLSYSQFFSSADHLSCMLLASGMQRGDRCAIFMEKSIEEAVSIFGINRAGGIFIDINHLHKPEQVKHILLDSGARYLFTTRQRLNQIKTSIQACQQLETVIVHGEGDLPELSGITVMDRNTAPVSSAAAHTNPAPVETDVAAIVYTSGSTGKPKGVVLSQRNLTAGAQSVCQYLGNTSKDRLLSVLPFSFDYGFSQLSTSVYSGATCVLINYLLINDIINAMKKNRITGLGLIPPLWLQLIQKEWDQTDFPDWRYLTNTGGRLPETAVRELRSRLPKAKIFLMYGLTEAFRGTFLDPDQVDIRPNSIGKAIPNAEIMIVKKDGKPCEPDEKGELIQRGAHVALGYWNNPEKTRKMFRPDPFALPGLQIIEKVVYSGDTVWKDAEGFIYYEGRTDELIKTSGYRVSPTEIEESLYKTGQVKHAAVFGIVDEILGQVPVAVVSLKNNAVADEKKLMAGCKQALPGYMAPKRIMIIPELPLNPTGKIDRPRVKHIYSTRGLNERQSGS